MINVNGSTRFWNDLVVVLQLTSSTSFFFFFLKIMNWLEIFDLMIICGDWAAWERGRWADVMQCIQIPADDLLRHALLDRPVPRSLWHGPEAVDHRQRLAEVAGGAGLQRTGSAGGHFMPSVIRLDPQHFSTRPFGQALPQGVVGVQPLGAVRVGQTLDVPRTPHHEKNQRNVSALLFLYWPRAFN